MSLTAEIVANWSNLLNSKNEDGFVAESSSLIREMEDTLEFPSANDVVKKAYADFLLQNLENVSEAARCNIISLLRILCRDDTGLTHLLTEPVCRMVMAAAFPPSRSPQVKALFEAEKCIINSLFHSVLARDIFADSFSGYLLDRIEFISQRYMEGQFSELAQHRFNYLLLLSEDLLIQFFFYDLRLCFKMTSGHNEILSVWSKDQSVLRIFCTLFQHTSNKAKNEEDDNTISSNVLLIMCNLMGSEEFDFATELAHQCSHLFKHALRCHNIPISTKNKIINILLARSIDDFDEHVKQMAPRLDEMELSKIGADYVFDGYDITIPKALLESIEDSLDNEPGSHLAIIFMAVLRYICEASDGARRYCRLQILPVLETEDVEQEEKTLRSKIAQILEGSDLCSRMATELVFTLCQFSPDRLMDYWAKEGLDHSAGLYANRGLLGSLNSRMRNESDSEDSETDDYRQVEDQVNPATGWENMSEKQREFETMKLLDTISRMMDTGVTMGEDGCPRAAEHISGLLNEYEPTENSDSD
ncbi:hypothetical protein QR680_015432 [Steinernema hermaphroditum]|uniref:Uncharacterized protein n=1 Tax=Steinernema hermaphroditum TaxID=289476 RepID=A0AA39H7M7_9BILA|nr:hypothetical protein QR680_015432 [Steinernema hermaphroditum]